MVFGCYFFFFCIQNQRRTMHIVSLGKGIKDLIPSVEATVWFFLFVAHNPKFQ